MGWARANFSTSARLRANRSGLSATRAADCSPASRICRAAAMAMGCSGPKAFLPGPSVK